MTLTLVTADYITAASGLDSFNGSHVIGLSNSHALLLDLHHEIGSGELSRVRVAALSGGWAVGAATTFPAGGSGVAHTMSVTSSGDVVIMTGKDGRGYRLISVDQTTDTVTVGSLVSAGTGTTIAGQKGALLPGTNDMIFVRTTSAGTYAEAVRVVGGTLTVLDTLALSTGAGAGDGWGTVIAIGATSAFAALSLIDGTLRIYRIVLTSGTLSVSHSDVTVAVEHTPYAQLYPAASSAYTAEIQLLDPADTTQYIRRGIRYTGSIVVDTLTLDAIDYLGQAPPDATGSWSLVASLPSTYFQTSTSMVVARPIEMSGDPYGGRFVILEYTGAGALTSYHWDKSGRGTGAGDATDLSGFYDRARGRVYLSDTDAYTLDYVGGSQGPYFIDSVAYHTSGPGGSGPSSLMDVRIFVTTDATYGVVNDTVVFDVQTSAADPTPPVILALEGNIGFYFQYGAGSPDLGSLGSFGSLPEHARTFTLTSGRSWHNIEWWWADSAGNPQRYGGTYVPIGFPDSETTRTPFTHRFGVNFTLGAIDLTLTNLRISSGHLVVDYFTGSGLASDRYLRLYAGHVVTWLAGRFTPPYTGGWDAGLYGVFGDLVGPIPASSSGTITINSGGTLTNNGDIELHNYYLMALLRTYPSGPDVSSLDSIGTPFAPAYKAAAGDIRLLEFALPATTPELDDNGYNSRTLFY